MSSVAHPQGNDQTAAGDGLYGISVDKEGLLHLFVFSDRVATAKKKTIFISTGSPFKKHTAEDAAPHLPVDEGDYMDVSRSELTYYLLGSDGDQEIPNLSRASRFRMGV